MSAVRCVYLSENLYVAFQYPPNCACWQAQSHRSDKCSELHAGTVLTLIRFGVYNRILSTQSNHLYTPWAYIPPWLLKEEGERLCCKSERKKKENGTRGQYLTCTLSVFVILHADEGKPVFTRLCAETQRLVQNSTVLIRHQGSDWDA